MFIRALERLILSLDAGYPTGGEYRSRQWVIPWCKQGTLSMVWYIISSEQNRRFLKFEFGFVILCCYLSYYLFSHVT